MDQVFQVNNGWLVALVAAILFDVTYPLVLAFIVWKRWGVRWRYFFFGAVIFFLFQLITRVPAVLVIQQLIQPQLAASRTLLLIWLIVLVLTAGIFEEVGRYIGYRWFMGRKDKTWVKSVMFGLGHGGLESILLVGGTGLLTLISLLALPNLNPASLPPEQRAAIAQQLAQMNALPVWTPLIGAYERLWTVPIQVAFSVMVLQVFRRGSLVWLWLAILAHALVDFVAVGITTLLPVQGMTQVLLPELAVTIFGIIAIWVIFKLREPPTPAVETPMLNPVNAGQ